MKVIIPAAGLGTRLRPHTYHRPKPLVNVAGDTVLGHVLRRLGVLEIDELVFIVGHLGSQIQAYVAEHYPQYRAHYVFQEELRGQAHALSLARDYLSGPLLIVFVDTIVDADYAALATTEADGVIHVQAVEDPLRFGIVNVGQDGYITQVVEKPDAPTSNLAVVGIYFVRDGAWLLWAIDQLLASGRLRKGEYYLADALQIMIDAGARLQAQPVAMWADCGTVPATLETNRYLLGQLPAQPAPPGLGAGAVVVPPVHLEPGVVIEHSVVGPYVHVGAGCRIVRSVVGPYVSLADGAEVRGAVVEDAIVDSGALIETVTLAASVIGAHARVRGRGDRLNVGDSSEIDAGA